ncbi:aldehyde dehydrogenase family protein [Streptomyces sp. SID3343]|uniref:aldehyde dehydrogenase family protein n=1 Tax=Streptomyces sp. SID3343 TaxID=2690260 RepID=UPI00136C27B3|nr:aldehyde dehydrogenase family protein [Streptomyces sp. SID3343]
MTVTSHNPADPADLVLARPAFEVAGTVRAVESARARCADWIALGAAARSVLLTRVAEAIEAHAAELVDLVVREVGKPLAEARGEVTRTCAIWRYYAQAPYAPTGAVHETAAGEGLLLTRRRPHGVAALITPWNFPLAIPTWKAAPALAVGNTVVLKPAPEATACALRLVELAQLPEGVFSVVPGGVEEGRALVDVADVVSFTGSTTVGRAVIAAATARGVPVQAEMGGLNAAIVLPDADIEQAAADLSAAIAGYAGQKCTATSRVIAVGAAYEPLRDALVKALDGIRPADPSAAATVCGPLISSAARDRVVRAIDSARATGATVVAGGTVPQRAGWFLEPTLLTDVADEHPLHTEEFFGPIAVLLRAVDIDEAIALANATPHTLAVSLHTRDLDAALTAADRLDAGMIRVNAPSSGVDFHVPFGGTKAASHGAREQGTAALDFFTATRTVSLLPSAASQ